MGRVGKEVSSRLPDTREEVTPVKRIGVFLDRDGTLNQEVDFLRDPDDLVLIPGAAEAVHDFNAAGFFTCVISNQSGVARGKLTEDDLVAVHARLEEHLGAGDARLDKILYCPHHPTAGRPPYNIRCDCRKPAPGMLRRAEREFGIDLQSSFVVGDKTIDVQTGQAVGATSILVLTGYGELSVEECAADGVQPDFIAPSIAEAAAYILQTVKDKRASHE